MSFIFRPGKHLDSDDEFSSRPVSVDFQVYDDSDNDLDVDIFLMRFLILHGTMNIICLTLCMPISRK